MDNRQWRFIIVGEDYDVRGTDDEKVATEAALADVVIEVPTCKVWGPQPAGIQEQEWFKFD